MSKHSIPNSPYVLSNEEHVKEIKAHIEAQHFEDLKKFTPKKGKAIMRN
jgi:hypothetical protein